MSAASDCCIRGCEGGGSSRLCGCPWAMTCSSGREGADGSGTTNGRGGEDGARGTPVFSVAVHDVEDDAVEAEGGWLCAFVVLEELS